MDVDGFPRLLIEEELLDFNEGRDEEIHPEIEYEADLTLNNRGNAWLTVDAVDFDSDEFYLGYFDGLFVRPGGSFDLPVLFSAPDIGLYEGMMTIHTNDPNREQVQIPLRAVVMPEALTGEENLPVEFAIQSVHPNPFNAGTILSYSLPRSGLVRLSVYDITGREVTTPLNGFREVGFHQVRIDAAGWSSGVYFVCLECGSDSKLAKVILIR